MALTEEQQKFKREVNTFKQDVYLTIQQSAKVRTETDKLLKRFKKLEDDIKRMAKERGIL